MWDYFNDIKLESDVRSLEYYPNSSNILKTFIFNKLLHLFINKEFNDISDIVIWIYWLLLYELDLTRRAQIKYVSTICFM